MIEINFNNVTKSYGFDIVLNKINLDIKTGEKIALVGENGSGKSTFLKLIEGEEKTTEGTISIRKESKIGFLKQDFSDYNENVKNILLDSFIEIKKIENELKKIEKKMDEGTNEKIINRYCDLQEKYMNIGGYQVEEEIDKLTSYFDIDNLKDKQYKDLSGGEKRIVMFISLILSKPDIILLDEPTNHLDIDMLEKIEKYISNSYKTFIIVSHDRYFLDKTVNKVILLENGNIEVFHGNYTNYINENEKRIEALKKDYKEQQREINKMKKQIKTLKEWGNFGAGNDIFSKRAFSIEKRLEKMEKIDRPIDKKELPISFNIENRSGKEVVNLKNYNLSISNKELIINSDINIYYGEKVALLGANGSGKSSLIKDIINNNRLGESVKVGYIPQNIEFDNEKSTVLEVANYYCNSNEEIVRSKLFHFEFYKNDINKQVRFLSGGERVRLKLFILLQEPINFIIMDEPTNHIDIETKEVLEKAFNEFKGTILFVSHDRYFINKVSTKLLLIDNKRIKTYIGNYDDYYLKK